MKIAVFSDIHGNLAALKKVLARIREQCPNQTVFLGDIFQRGNEELECLDMLMESGVTCIKGNCELYVAYGVDVDPDVEYLREYYDSARAKLTEEQMEFIKKLPLCCEIEAEGHTLRFSHFLFKETESPYPFLQLSSLKDGTFDKACESEAVRKYDLAVVGHSHQNFVKGNVVSVSAAGLEGASFLMIDVSRDKVTFKHISLS